NDLLAWQRGFGAGPEAASRLGDANGDGFVNADDLRAWQSAFAASSRRADLPVAEPHARNLLVTAALVFSFWRRRTVATGNPAKRRKAHFVRPVAHWSISPESIS
ncbi:MAG: hypothetical protein AAF961_09320, partial [Planctomycetota bacterium]